jgi:galactonate dehydratase
VKITRVEPILVGAGWKNWLFVRVHADNGAYGVGEGTLNGFGKTTEAAVNELAELIIGRDPRNITQLSERLLKCVSNDGGHIHRAAVAAMEVALWDLLGKTLGVPVWQLLGGKVRDSVLAYANGWYRTERTPEAFVLAAEGVVGAGFAALKLDPFGTANGFISDNELELAFAIVSAIRERFPKLEILIDVHARFTEVEAVRAAEKFAPLRIYWWEEPTTRDREHPSNTVAHRSPIRIATGETFYLLGQFYTLAAGGGVNIFQPEPISLGGIMPTLSVAHLAKAAGAWIAPHQSGGPVATAICLQLAACVPNFLIQEYFDPFNLPWTRDLVTWAPTINPENGHINIPNGPGIGVDLNLDVALAHPYDPAAYLNVFEPGWEMRLGSKPKSAPSN